MHVINLNILSVGTFPINSHDIIYIETEERNLLVHTRDRKFTCTGTLKDIQE